MRAIQLWSTAILLAGLGLPLVPAPASAQEVRIAVVDARRALITSNQGQQAEKQLKTLVDKKKAEIEPLEKELKRKEMEFESQRYVLSASVAEERKLELIKEQRDLERSMREAQDELEIAQRKLMKPMLRKVEEALTQIGKEKSFTVILEKSSPGLLYTAEALDITDLVIQRLNQKQ